MADLYDVADLRLSLADMTAKPLLGAAPRIEILRGLTFTIPKGAAIGIVGGSGSGKSTLGRALVRLLEPSGGAVRLDGTDITHLSDAALRPMRRRFQMIFQDPMSSLNPRHRVGTIIAEPLRLHGMDGSPARVARALASANGSASPAPSRWNPTLSSRTRSSRALTCRHRPRS